MSTTQDAQLPPFEKWWREYVKLEIHNQHMDLLNPDAIAKRIARDAWNEAASLAASSAKEEDERCAGCGHSGTLDPNGECMHVERDAGGSLVYCHHRCDFSPLAPAVQGDSEAATSNGFPWGTRISINGEAYWLNKCIPCKPTGSPTYHVIKGDPSEYVSLTDETYDDALTATPSRPAPEKVEVARRAAEKIEAWAQGVSGRMRPDVIRERIASIIEAELTKSKTP